MTDEEPAYQYDFGNLLLTATQVTNLSFQPVFLFGGAATYNRSIGVIDFEMPLDVESFEQGVAWIVNRLGKNYRPRNLCPWFEQGWGWQDHLPWIQERKRYESRPKCTVDRDWFRVACKKLRELALTANNTDLAEIIFDGEILKLKVCGQTIAMPAEGKTWGEKYAIKAQELDFLPKRLMQSKIHISVYEGRLTIGNHVWRITENTN